jgi:hypothetical protein
LFAFRKSKKKMSSFAPRPAVALVEKLLQTRNWAGGISVKNTFFFRLDNV